MNLSVVLPTEVIPSNNTSKCFILVGQRTTSEGQKGTGQVAFVVFDAIPCVDTDVVSEQLECLQHVLPCGINLIGFLLCAGGGADLDEWRSALKSHPLEVDLFTVICNDGKTVGCRLLQTNNPIPLTIVPGKPPFLTLSCCLRMPLMTMPLVVRSFEKGGTDVIIIDLNGTTEVCGDTMLLAGGSFCATQLGSSAGNTGSVLIWLDVAVAMGYSCGRDIYDVIRGFVPRLEPHPDRQIALLQSRRNSALIFQWVYTPAADENKGFLKAQWNELRDLIEDGTGERVKLSQVVSYTSVPNLFFDSVSSKTIRPRSGVTEEKERNPSQQLKEMQTKGQGQKNTMRCLLPATIALFAAVFFPFIWKLSWG